MVSVIMPAYNAEKTIAASVASVLAQTYGDYELIIIDGHSTDGTLAAARAAVADSDRVKIISLGKKNSLSFTRNFGVGIARGEWIAYLDSDDMWDAEKLKKQTAFIKETGAEISYTASAFIDETGARYRYIMPAVFIFTYAMLLKKNLMSCSSVIIKKSLAKKYPMGGDEMHEDYSCWLSVLRECGHACGLNLPLLTYRLSKGSKSAGRIKSARMIFNSYRREGRTAAAAFFMSLRYARHSISKRIKIKMSGKISVPIE